MLVCGKSIKYLADIANLVTYDIDNINATLEDTPEKNQIEDVLFYVLIWFVKFS